MSNDEFVEAIEGVNLLPQVDKFLPFPESEKFTCQTIPVFCGFRDHWAVHGGVRPLS